MKNITICTVDIEGNKIDESHIQVDDHEILLVKLSENTSMENARQIHDTITLGIKMMSSVIAIPETVNFQVLKIGDSNAD